MLDQRTNAHGIDHVFIIIVHVVIVIIAIFFFIVVIAVIVVVGGSDTRARASAVVQSFVRRGVLFFGACLFGTTHVTVVTTPRSRGVSSKRGDE